MLQGFFSAWAFQEYITLDPTFLIKINLQEYMCAFRVTLKHLNPKKTTIVTASARVRTTILGMGDDYGLVHKLQGWVIKP